VAEQEVREKKKSRPLVKQRIGDIKAKKQPDPNSLLHATRKKELEQEKNRMIKRKDAYNKEV
jgi:hypothetical protein